LIVAILERRNADGTITRIRVHPLTGQQTILDDDPAAELVDVADRVATRVPIFMSTDPKVRKMTPIASGCSAYFPDALACVAWISRVGNDQHNPGEPLHWAKEKSADELDALTRHVLDHLKGAPVDAALSELGELAHLSQAAWRALAALQRACDAKRKAFESGK
jgi:hypothetical protein